MAERFLGKDHRVPLTFEQRALKARKFGSRKDREEEARAAKVKRVTADSTLYKQGIAHFRQHGFVLEVDSRGMFLDHCVYKTDRLGNKGDHISTVDHIAELEQAWVAIDDQELSSFWYPLVAGLLFRQAPLTLFTKRLLAIKKQSMNNSL